MSTIKIGKGPKPIQEPKTNPVENKANAATPENLKMTRLIDEAEYIKFTEACTELWLLKFFKR